jgi:hypothetical protein
MNKSLITILCVLALAVSVSAVTYTELDYVNIGDTTSEAGHNVNGWSDILIGNSGYGGFDDSNLGGGTLRTVIPRIPGCVQDDKEAFFTMSTTGTAYELRLRHLQGSQNDAYDFYVKEGGNWVKLTPASISTLDPYCSNNECWYTDTYALNGLTGTVEFKVVSTIGTIPAWCETWGLNAFSWAQLNGTPGSQIPEFSAVAAGIALAGAATGFVLLRKRR